MDCKIDFVITWVDPSDPEWQKEKIRYEGGSPDADIREVRYRDWGCLKYIFRGIEKYAPWVNKVFFITCGQKPAWLNTEHEKLICVSHDEFMPKDSLPVFSVNPIHVNLHNIKNLSENFVLFDDDMFLIDHVRPQDFFYKGQPCDSAVMVPIIPTSKDGFTKCVHNNISIINSHFDKKKSIRRNWKKWFNPLYKTYNIKTMCMMPWNHFTGFWEGHVPNSIKKSTIKLLWKKEPEIMRQTAYSRFRNNNTDITQWLFSEWNIASGNFCPRDVDFGHYFECGKDSGLIHSAIIEHKYKTICLNDSDGNYDFEKEKRKMIKAFNAIFPVRSKFEK